MLNKYKFYYGTVEYNKTGGQDWYWTEVIGKFPSVVINRCLVIAFRSQNLKQSSELTLKGAKARLNFT